MTAITVTLAWPPRDLSPNGRAHHMKKWRLAQAAKDTAYWLTRAALGRSEFTADGDVEVWITAAPIKGKPRPDEDNLTASMKASLDGIAAGLRVDDSRFRIQAIEWADPVPNGAVTVSIRPQAEGE